jgi:membrane protein DedA with SNARE-associated domain
MRIIPFTIYTVIGAGLWNAALVFCGVALRRNWETILGYSRWVDLGVLLVLAGLVALFLAHHLRRRAG